MQCFCCGLFPSAPPWGARPRCCTPISSFLLVVQARADIRIRVRSIVIRIRIRHTAIRVRIVVPAIDHTASWETPPFFFQCKVTHILPKLSSPTSLWSPFNHCSSATGHKPRIFKIFRPAYAGNAISVLSLRSRFGALRFPLYASSLSALYAATLCALTSLPRKARREPTFACAYEAS